MLAVGTSNREIARALGRGMSGVQGRLKTLGLTSRVSPSPESIKGRRALVLQYHALGYTNAQIVKAIPGYRKAFIQNDLKALGLRTNPTKVDRSEYFKMPFAPHHARRPPRLNGYVSHKKFEQ